MSGQFHAPVALLLGKDPPAPIHWIGRWVDPKAGMDAAANERIPSLLLPGTDNLLSSPWPIHYSDW